MFLTNLQTILLIKKKIQDNLFLSMSFNIYLFTQFFIPKKIIHKNKLYKKNKWEKHSPKGISAI